MIRNILVMGISGTLLFLGVTTRAQDPTSTAAPSVQVDGASVGTYFAPTGGVPSTLDGTNFNGVPANGSTASTGVAPDTILGTGELGAPATGNFAGDYVAPSTNRIAGGDPAPATGNATAATGAAPSTQNGSGSRAVPATGDVDFGMVLPVYVPSSRANGLTDRFGMPLMMRFGKSPRANPAISAENEAIVDGNRAVRPSRRVITKTDSKDIAKAVRPRQRSLGNRSGAVPQYYIPRGSLDWAPGAAPVNTGPADPFGYGYGNSGYGTEVFGDFWKGWPMVD